jgi:hypothetical protein
LVVAKETVVKKIVGYDKDFARQFFLRTFQSLAPGGFFSEDKRIFLPEEFDYMATQLSDTTTFSLMSERFGSPWWRGDPGMFEYAIRKTEDEHLLKEAEDLANALMIRTGIVARKESPWVLLEDIYKEIIRRLYLNASKRPLSESRKFVLHRMARNVQPWTELLSMVPGNDSLQSLLKQTSPLILPDEV